MKGLLGCWQNCWRSKRTWLRKWNKEERPGSYLHVMSLNLRTLLPSPLITGACHLLSPALLDINTRCPAIDTAVNGCGCPHGHNGCLITKATSSLFQFPASSSNWSTCLLEGSWELLLYVCKGGGKQVS